MSNFLERGQYYYNLSRYKEAEQEFQKALATEPNHAIGLALMALVYLETDRREEALPLTKRALGEAPYSSFVFYVLARTQFYNQDSESALQTIKEGKGIDPENADFFLLESQIYFHQSNWASALQSANQGLELSPENVHLINLRAQSLVKLNRQTEASETLDYALRKAPENAYSHANKGWVHIEKDQYDEAVHSFKESLRLDASNEYAKHGLKEAIKGKNILYRGVLKYFLWMGKLQEKGQWTFIIGAYIGYQIVLRVSEAIPALAPLLYPIIIFYILFAFSTWIARPISNLFLRFHPLGKLALTEDEIFASTITGMAGAGAIISLVLFYLGLGGVFLYLGAFLGIMLIPIGGLFGMPEGTLARRNLTVYSIVLALCGLGFIILPQYDILAILFLLGVFFYGFVANYMVTLSNRRV